MVSDLIASCCRLQADDGKYHLPYTCSAQEIDEFTEYGVITVPLLEKCFSTHYVEGLFTAQNFVDLLTYLLIASTLDDRTHTRYFMPSLSSSTCIQLSTAPNHTCFLVKLQTRPLGLFFRLFIHASIIFIMCTTFGYFNCCFFCCDIILLSVATLQGYWAHLQAEHRGY